MLCFSPCQGLAGPPGGVQLCPSECPYQRPTSAPEPNVCTDGSFGAPPAEPGPGSMMPDPEDSKFQSCTSQNYMSGIVILDIQYFPPFVAIS